MNRAKVVALALVPATVVGGAGLADAATSPQAAPAVRQSYDAHTLFKGLFFGQGPAARALPEYVGEQAVSPQQAAVTEAMIQGMESRHPGTVAAVKEAVGSGSEPRIKAALTRASHNLNSVYTTRGARDPRRPNIVAALPAVAAVVVYVWKWTWQYSSAEQGNAALTSLQKDKFVHQIATRLR